MGGVAQLLLWAASLAARRLGSGACSGSGPYTCCLSVCWHRSTGPHTGPTRLYLELRLTTSLRALLVLPQGPFSLRKGAALREVLRTYRTAQVFFNEGPVSDEPIWLPELVQFAIVRHPLPRLLSQLLHTASLASEALFQDILRVSGAGGALPAHPLAPCGSCRRRLGGSAAAAQRGPPLAASQEPNTLIREILNNQTLPARYFRPGTTEWFSPDSYTTRVFAGTSVDASRRRLYTLDLQLAVDNLDRMDAVLLYEEMLREPSSSLVSELLGGLPPMTAQRKTGRATSFSSQHSAQVMSKLNNGTMGMLFEYLEFDFRLYEHCRLLHNVTLAAYESLRDRRGATVIDR